MTKTEKIIQHFLNSPNADVKKAAAKFKTAPAVIYKLRKRARDTAEANAALEEMLEMPPTPEPRKITLSPTQVALANKLGIPLETFVKAGIANGTLQYDDEKLPLLGDEGVETEAEVDEILNARAKNYGKFIEGAEIMQMTKRLVHNYIEQRGTAMAFDQLEAIDMIIHKLGRIINGNPDHLDNWVDIAGYATLVVDRLNGRAR